MTSFSIVGAGRLGTALAFALTRKGWDLAVIADGDAAAARESRRIVGRGRATGEIRRAAGGAGILFICVPDDAVEAVAGTLSRSGGEWPGRIVFHTSGLLPAAALEALRRKGARVASLHPVQSFPSKKGGGRLFRGIFWGLEGDRDAVRLGREVARALGGRSVVLREKDKPLYHAACSLASNAFLSLEATAAALLREAGVSEKSAAAALMLLVKGTLRNVKKLGMEKSLTGPVVRGDVRTVRSHLEALKFHPLEGEIYRALGKQALGLITERNIPAHKVRALRLLLEGKRLPLRASRRTSRRRVP